MKIQEILQRYDNPMLRVSTKIMRDNLVLESKVPQEGAYWWLPRPDGEWDLDAYYESEFGEGYQNLHIELWPNYVLDRLALLWKKDLKELQEQIGNAYTGLPRGRVSKGQSYGIYHGNDSPVEDWIKRIVAAFNLQAMVRQQNVREVFDEHEVMLPPHQKAVQQALKY